MAGKSKYKDYESALERLEEIMHALGFNAIVELAMSADRLAGVSAPSTWNITESELEDELPVVSRGSEWSVAKDTTESQWKFERAA